MTRHDVNVLKEALCPHDDDYELPCISPHNLEIVLEQILLDSENQTVEVHELLLEPDLVYSLGDF